MGRGGIITRIEVQKRRPHRRSIFLDDAFAFGLDEEIVLRNDLRVGQKLDDDQIETLLLGEEEKKGREYVLNLLSYRDRSCREVGDRLREKGYDDEMSGRIVDSLKRARLLNDERFAREWGRERLKNRPMGARLLNQELWKKGIPPQIIERTIESLYSETDEVALAAAALASRRDRYKGEKARQRAADFLLRRGFSWDVVEEVWGEGESDT